MNANIRDVALYYNTGRCKVEKVVSLAASESTCESEANPRRERQERESVSNGFIT
jgi:hypothetical protein